MEAVRPSPRQNAHHNYDMTTAAGDRHCTFESFNTLPPPPTPFPVEQIEQSSSQDAVGSSSQVSKQSCVHALSTLIPADENDSYSNVNNIPLPEKEGQLAVALTELLEVTYELEAFLPRSKPSSVPVNETSTINGAPRDLPTSYDALLAQLHGLQAAHGASAPSVGDSQLQTLHPAINEVREQLAWARLESLNTAVLQLVQLRERPEAQQYRSHHDDARPPSYEHHRGHGGLNQVLPSYYDLEGSVHVDLGSARTAVDQKAHDADPQLASDVPQMTRHTSSGREKMLQDLEGVTNAIERLYRVAPQLNDQRVELRVGSKTASTLSQTTFPNKGQVLSEVELEQQKMKELEEIWDRIERAHGKRKMRGENEQRADQEQLESRRRERFLNRSMEYSESGRSEGQVSSRGCVDEELARAESLRDRDRFLRDLVQQSANGRFGDQDAEAPNDDIESSRRLERMTFINDVITRSRAGRMSDQDTTLSAEDKLDVKRSTFIDGLVGFGESGRMTDQDSHPPSPRANARTGQDELSQFELVTAHDFLIGLPRANANEDARTDTDQQNGQSLRVPSKSLPQEEDDSKRLTGSVSTFHKIAGMVRRGSAHLGIKTNNAFDPTSLAYVAEHQENLRVVQVMLHGPGVSSDLEMKLETDGACEIVISSKRESSITINLPLPTACASTHNSIALTPHPLHLEGKIAALPTTPQSSLPSLSTSLTYALSASELRELRPEALCCTSCDGELADVSAASVEGEYEAGRGYKDLPSEHWAEMMEVWMCHADPSFTARLAERTKEGFWPKDGTVLVGGSYLLVEGVKVKRSNLHLDKAGKDQAWNVASCVCGEVVGKWRINDGKPGSNTIRFFKWAIALLRHDYGEESVEPIRYPLSVFVVSDMLELAQAHASYRFIISSEEEGQPRVYIWLFNPSVNIAYRLPLSPLPSPHKPSASHYDRANDSDETAQRRRLSAASTANSYANKRGQVGLHAIQRVLRAAKVMYKVVDPSKSESDLENLPGFGPQGQVEHLSYTREVCERLIGSLRQSTLVYPLSRRTMGAFEVGFLERT